jgi:hypothetical protein
MLIMNIPNEEEAFWVFVSIMMPDTHPHPILKLRGKRNWRLSFVETMEKTLDLE